MKYLKPYNKFTSANNKCNTVSFVAVGDMLAHNAVQDDAMIGNQYDYSSLFSALKEQIKGYDLKYCNAETPITNGKRNGGEIGDMGTAIFSADSSFGDAIINTGFNIISIANNHVLDNGVDGLEQIRNYWYGKNIVCSGLGNNSEYSRVSFFTKNEIKFAFVSYTTRVNMMHKKRVSGINIWDDQFGVRDIMFARNNADVVIVSMHWGKEYMLGSTNEEQEHISELLSQLGVDIIIGTHPHVIQPIRWIDKTLCIYSLGNCVAKQNGNECAKRVGGIVSMDIKKRNYLL